MSGNYFAALLDEPGHWPPWAHLHAGNKRLPSVHQGIRNSVGEDVAAINDHDPVAMGRFCGKPMPALVFVGPQSRQKCLKAARRPRG